MSGAKFPSMAAVEDALLDVFRADQRLTDWDATIITVPGFSEKKVVARLFARFPGVGTFLPSGEYGGSGIQRTETAPLWIFCAGQNFSNPALPRRGGPHEPGALQLVGHCAQIIEGWNPGGNIRHIQPERWQAVWNSNQISVHALICSVEIWRPAAPIQEEINAYGSGIK